MVYCILCAVLGMIFGSGLTESWCRDRWWYPRWKEGFDKGYAMGKKHGIECGRIELLDEQMYKKYPVSSYDNEKLEIVND